MARCHPGRDRRRDPAAATPAGLTGAVRVGVGVACVALVGVASVACVPNVAAPARTTDGYRAAAGKAVEAAIGSVGTAALLCQAGVDGQAFFPYLSVAISDAEDQLGSVTTTFESIQPPTGPEAALVRQQTTALLGQAGDDVTDARIAIRDGDAASLPPICDALDEDGQSLEAVAP